MTEPSKLINISLEILRAQQKGVPIVALESTVITHGLPRPQNLILAQDMEQIIRDENATPATIAVMDGKIQAGMTSTQLERLANSPRSQTGRSTAYGIRTHLPSLRGS